jgi:hypothetical protein
MELVLRADNAALRSLIRSIDNYSWTVVVRLVIKPAGDVGELVMNLLLRYIQRREGYFLSARSIA